MVVLSVPLLDTREAALIAILTCAGALAAGDLATYGHISAARSQEIVALYGLFWSLLVGGPPIAQFGATCLDGLGPSA